MVTVCLLLQVLYIGEVRAAAVTSGRDIPNGSADASAPALDATEVFDFQGRDIPSIFELSGEISTNVHDAEEGARLIVRQDHDATALVLPGSFQSGRVEVFVKSVVAAGVLVAVRLRSGSSDEIALELLGGEVSLVASSVYHSEDHEMNSSDLETTKVVAITNAYLNLTIDWTAQSVQWLADGNVVGTLAHANDTHLHAFSQLALTAELRDDQSNEREMVAMRRVPYFAEVMNMTITHYHSQSLGALENTDNDAPGTERILQRWPMTEMKTGSWLRKRSYLSVRDVHLSDKTKLAFGLTVGIGGGSLVFLVCFALFRVNGYCRFRRKKNAPAIYSGEMSSQRTTPRTTQTTLVNSPQPRGDSRNTYYYNVQSDRRHTCDHAPRGQRYDRDGTGADRRHSHQVAPREQRYTHDTVHKERRYTHDRIPQERRCPHDRGHPYRRYTQDDRNLEYRRYTHDGRSPKDHRHSHGNRSPEYRNHTQDRATGNRRHTRDNGQNDRTPPQVERNNRKGGQTKDHKQQKTTTPAVSSGNKHKPSEASKIPEVAKIKQEPPTVPEERKTGPLAFLLAGGRKKSPQPEVSKKAPSARVPSIAELDGQGVSEQLATVIKRRRSLEKKPLPTAPQLSDSDLAAVRHDDGDQDGGNNEGVVRYNLYGL
ncbi:hypothetical protein PFICI_01802 [Pestalotiopsis fici W106-1]|uniref:GH16 domain-containing protein n=1 Tax=Pestalotiopsis fici (strain W106-1 / CGMCC3.15140) TaxID=1229662 RepID=W3XPR4_PESFW|nr:uncharacterized protein PFICI_01802 [Pestalotiopsis fici W106-1]ETS87974.1 hypothetical protein PFICI_01802 [Pestalotiopsis fici W106-1]